MNREPENAVWRDLTDPRRAEYLDNLEEGLKEPEFDNVQIPEKFGARTRSQYGCSAHS